MRLFGSIICSLELVELACRPFLVSLVASVAKLASSYSSSLSPFFSARVSTNFWALQMVWISELQALILLGSGGFEKERVSCHVPSEPDPFLQTRWSSFVPFWPTEGHSTDYWWAVSGPRKVPKVPKE